MRSKSNQVRTTVETANFGYPAHRAGNEPISSRRDDETKNGGCALRLL